MEQHDAADDQRHRDHIDDQRARAITCRTDQRQRRQDGEQFGEEIAERRRVRRRRRQSLRHAADRLAQRRDPQRDDETGNADDQECRLPAVQAERTAQRVSIVPALDDQAANAERQSAANVKPGRVDGERGGAQPAREPVRNQRIGARTCRRLTHADPNPRGAQHGAAARKSRHRRHRRPQGQADRHEPDAVPIVRQTAERNTEQRIENAERRPIEKTEIAVLQMEVTLDVLGEDRDDLAIDEIEHIDQEQDGQDVPGISRSAGWFCRRIAGHTSCLPEFMCEG